MRKALYLFVFLLFLLIGIKEFNNIPKKEMANKVKINNNYLEVDFKKLKKINDEIIGWIIIKDTTINYPILKTTNNDFYKEHDYKKEHNLIGSIYQDCVEKGLYDSQITLYGNNLQKNQFADLRKIYNNELGNDIYIKIITENSIQTYKVFKTLKNNKINEDINFEIDLKEEDYILTLKTIPVLGTNNYEVQAIRIEEE